MDHPQIFLSWSGEASRDIALELKRWFETVFEDLRAWVSDTDIALGARSIPAIEESLDKSVGGILVLTVENQSSPWVNYEAGALSRQYQGREGRVIPLLVNATSMGELRSPLSNFQGQLLNQLGVERILRAIYGMLAKNEELAPARMRAYWPELEGALEPLLERASRSRPSEPAISSEITELRDQLSRMERTVNDLANQQMEYIAAALPAAREEASRIREEAKRQGAAIISDMRSAADREAEVILANARARLSDIGSIPEGATTETAYNMRRSL